MSTWRTVYRVAKVMAISWLLSPSSATKMTAVLNRKAYMGDSSPRRRAEESVSGRPFDQARPMNGCVCWSKVSSATAVDPVAHRTGPGGQCVDAAIGDYSLSTSTVPGGGGAGRIEQFSGPALRGLRWSPLGPTPRVVGLVVGSLTRVRHSTHHG
ncbi:hypothetical protein GCM10025782_04580 [Pedococcus ginsenosidimutans]|uniref:Secreted protein n=1 Tax=Pedococcus ginsenosidimutans TaxID=490570 RepID=A0ABP8XQ95_9MICO